MHELTLLFAIVSLYFCNKPIRPIIATPHATQINGSCDQTFKIDAVATTHLRVIVDVTCTWRYTHTYVCQDTHVLTYAWFFVCFISHKRVTREFSACSYTFCVRLS